MDDRLRLEVEDTGSGIPPELLAHIFDPWVTTKAQGKGSGLGLSIARQVVVSHGGTIRVDNRPGTGAVFTIDLPAAQDYTALEYRSCREFSSLTTTATRVGSSPKCSPAPGREFELAAETERALDLARSEPFDLVICDINLNSSLSGLDVLRAFKAVNPKGQVLLVSGFGTLETAIEAVRAGAFDYISKPFDIEEVKKTVQRALDQTGRGQSLRLQRWTCHRASSLDARPPCWPCITRLLAPLIPSFPC